MPERPETSPVGSRSASVSGRVRGSRSPLLVAGLICCFLTCLGCGRGARSKKSFDAVRSAVAGKSAAEVEVLLGKPDSRVRFLLGDERWTWWKYTYLDGPDYAPEVRGRVVHLSITFLNPSPESQTPRPYSEWKIVEPLGVSYLLPQERR